MDDRDIRHLVEPLRRGWWIVALVAVTISAVVYFYYRNSTPTYTANTSVYVQASSLDQLLGVGGALADPERTVKNQARLLQTSAVAGEVAQKLKFEGDPRELLSLVEATAADGSDFVQIEATGSSARQAAEVANGFAEAFVDLGVRRLADDAANARSGIERELSNISPSKANRTLRRDLRNGLERIALVEAVPTQAARQVDRAVAPTEGTAADPVQNTIFAGLLGIVLGCLLVYGLKALDRRVPPSNVEAEYGMPRLASIPLDRKAAAKARALPLLPDAMIEPIRTVRTTLDHGVQEGPVPRTILVMSALSGEGKSTLTKGLALGFHESGRSALVIDADLRKPVLHQFFGLDPEPGLSDVLRGSTTLSRAVSDIVPSDDETEDAGQPATTKGASPFIFSTPTITSNGNGDLAAAESVLSALSSGVDDMGHVARSVRSLASETDYGMSAVRKAIAELEAVGRIRVVPHERPHVLRHGTTYELPALDADDDKSGASHAGPVLHLLACGSEEADPASLLGSYEMGRLLDEAAATYDVVLVDSSPLLSVSDVVPLTAAVDGVIAVTRSDYTTRDDAQRFRRALARLPRVNVLGLVVNGVRGSEIPRYDAGDS